MLVASRRMSSAMGGYGCGGDGTGTVITVKGKSYETDYLDEKKTHRF